jgi:hypothetical protein
MLVALAALELQLARPHTVIQLQQPHHMAHLHRMATMVALRRPLLPIQLTLNHMDHLSHPQHMGLLQQFSHTVLPHHSTAMVARLLLLMEDRPRLLLMEHRPRLLLMEHRPRLVMVQPRLHSVQKIQVSHHSIDQVNSMDVGVYACMQLDLRLHA